MNEINCRDFDNSLDKVENDELNNYVKKYKYYLERNDYTATRIMKEENYTEMSRDIMIIRNMLKNSKKDKLNKLLYDLDDYLIDREDGYDYLDKKVERDYVLGEEIYNDIQEELDGISEDKYMKILDSLNNSNPRFCIKLFSYDYDFVEGIIDYDYSVDFLHYRDYAQPMKNYMGDTYKWNATDKNVKKEIINRRCGRIRFITERVSYSKLIEVANSNQKEDNKWIYLDRDRKFEVNQNNNDSFVDGYKVPIRMQNNETIQDSEYGDDDNDDNEYDDNEYDVGNEANEPGRSSIIYYFFPS